MAHGDDGSDRSGVIQPYMLEPESDLELDASPAEALEELQCIFILYWTITATALNIKRGRGLDFEGTGLCK